MVLQLILRHVKINVRSIQTKAVKEKPKFTSTINLPKTKFPPRLAPNLRTEVEDKLRKRHLSLLYEWQKKNLTEPAYVLHDGPPYANGDLHMGHAVNKVLKDIILKNKIINGKKVHYSPGWDCHGLPIELKALANQKTKSPVEIRKNARKFALSTVEKQKQAFESWGVTGSWNSPTDIYKTLDKDYVKNQLTIFNTMYENGLIFRDLKPVFWSPASGSALAEAELEYDENFLSSSLYVTFKITNCEEVLKAQNVHALIWTTTPWTLPANQAVCYNKNLKYCLVQFEDPDKLYIMGSDALANLSKELDQEIKVIQEFQGDLMENLKYQHPINDDEIAPFYEASHVQADKGTGLVHTAPSHGPDDFLVFLNKKVPLKRLVNEQGIYNDSAPAFLRNQEVLKSGNQLVLNHLTKNDVVVKVGKFKHSYPIDWRTKTPVIIIASEQWFINTEKIKEKAIQELENVQIFPKLSSDSHKNVLKSQLQKRPYWCISRQRAWGVPIPVFYNKSKNQPIFHPLIIKRIEELLEKTGNMDFWWEMEVKELLTPEILKHLELSSNDLKKGADILDIWFDSGISWSYALKGNQIADLYLEGVDQFTGWFQSSLMTSVGVRESAPYKGIFVHGFAVDEKGHKMSKSLGNIIKPEDICKKFGVDAMRFWIAAHATQHTSIPVSMKLLEDSAVNLGKIRASLKYLMGSIDQNCKKSLQTNTLSHLDKQMLHNLTIFEKNISNSYETYQFNRVVAQLNHFVNTDLSSFYLHIIKDRLYCGTNEQSQQLKQILSLCYLILCKSLWPIAPFLVEESWSYHNESPEAAFYSQPCASATWEFTESLKIIQKVMEAKKSLCSMITDQNSWKLRVRLGTNTENLKILQEMHPKLNQKVEYSELCEILQVSSILLEESKDLKDSEWNISFEVVENELCLRCRRFEVKENCITCSRCLKVLEIKEFTF